MDSMLRSSILLVLLAGAAMATTHAPPPWRRAVRAIQQQQTARPSPTPSQRLNIPLGQQVRQQLEQMYRMLQLYTQQNANRRQGQPSRPPPRQPARAASPPTTPTPQKPQQQAKKQKNSQPPPPPPQQQQPAGQKELQTTTEGRPLTEVLGSSLLRDMQRMLSASPGDSPAPTLPPGALSPRPFHQGAAKAVIAETNHQFAVPQDPSVLGISGADLEAAAKGAEQMSTRAEARRGADPENNTVIDEVSEPSKCVWAIVSCCTPQTDKVRYSCFELLGCHGAFWDLSPCDQAVAKAALQHAIKYYQSGGKPRDQPKQRG